MNKERFEKVDSQYSSGTSLLGHRTVTDPNSMVGDFLSRLWSLYGPPDGVGFEGFDYTFKDLETGLVFTAYFGGSGGAYGGHAEHREQLLPVVEAFDQLVDAATPADCEITFENDFGSVTAGAKNGVPYDIYREEY